MEEYIGAAVAVNFTSALIVPMFLILLKTPETPEMALTGFKVIKKVLASLCFVGAIYDACLFFFSKTGQSQLMNDFALPTVFYFIVISILFSTWQILHVEKRNIMFLVHNAAIGVATTTAYLIGIALYSSPYPFISFEHFIAFDSSTYGYTICCIQSVLLLITVVFYGPYTAYLAYKAHKESMELLPEEMKRGINNMSRIAVLVGIYFIMILGDMVFQSPSYDIFLLVCDPIIIILIAIETLNSFATYKRYEEELEKKRMNEQMADRDKVFMKALNEWVENKRYCDGTLSVYDVARELNVSYGYMNNYFKNIVHVPFRTWRIGLRIDEAKRIMVEEDNSYSISDIASRVGYNDRANFYRHFKDYEDSTPEEYRKRAMKSKKIED